MSVPVAFSYFAFPPFVYVRYLTLILPSVLIRPSEEAELARLGWLGDYSLLYKFSTGADLEARKLAWCGDSHDGIPFRVKLSPVMRKMVIMIH